MSQPNDGTPSPPPTSSSGWLRLSMWLSLGVLLLSVCFARVSRVRMDDDNLYLAYAAQSEPARALPLEQSLITRVGATPGCEASTYRLGLRQRYASNYAGYLGVQRALQHLVGFFVSPGPALIIATTLAVKSLFLLLSGLVLLLVTARSSDRGLVDAVVSSFVALAALDIAAQWLPTFLNVHIDQPARAMAELGYSFFVTPRAYSYFGLTPRNAALLLFVIGLILKWRGRLVWAAVAILLIAPLHQTYAGLGVVLFAAATAVTRPEAFTAVAFRLILLGAGLVYVVRERFLDNLSVGARIACTLALVAFGLLTFSFISGRAFASIRQRWLGRWTDREIPLDATTLVVLALVVTAASLVGAQLTGDVTTRAYFWADFATRIWSFVRFPVAIAFFWLLSRRTRWAAGGRGRARFASACVVLCLASSGVALSEADSHPWIRLSRQLSTLLGKPRDRRTFNPSAEEPRIYAHLAMVAAGELTLARAEERLVRGRPIRCAPKPGKAR